MPRYKGEPDDSCPVIDDIISELEKMRKINETLRFDNRDLQNQVDALEDEKATLLDLIEDLQFSIQELKQGVAA